jgi:hypothetical protein
MPRLAGMFQQAGWLFNACQNLLLGKEDEEEAEAANWFAADAIPWALGDHS